MTDKFTASFETIRMKPVRDSQGVCLGYIECLGSVSCPYYVVDNQLARKFDISPHKEFKTVGAIMKIINGG